MKPAERSDDVRRDGFDEGEVGGRDAVRRLVVVGARWRGRSGSGVIGKARGTGGGAGVSANVRHDMSGAWRRVTGIVIGPPLT